MLFNPVPDWLKVFTNWQGKFYPLLHLGRCSQNYISNLHMNLLSESYINSKAEKSNVDARYLLKHLIKKTTKNY